MPAFRMSAQSKIGAITVLAAGLMIVPLTTPVAFAGDAMPFEQQDALVHKYCAGCHTDSLRQGGLSLEHFDSSHAPRSLAAMMVSKLTAGVPLETVKAAASDPRAAALVNAKMKAGAMGAAGIPVPDKPTIDALISALAYEASGAMQWDVNRAEDPSTSAPILTASVSRELPSARNAGTAAMYRLALTCNPGSREGEMQLSWAPVPTRGALSAYVDGKAAMTYKVEGPEEMGNRSGLISAGAFISLSDSRNKSVTIALPAQTLTVKGLVPNEVVEFSFGDLPETARRELSLCFAQSVGR